MNRALHSVWTRTVRRVGYPGVLGILMLVPALAVAAWLPRLKHDANDATTLLAERSRAVSQRLKAMPPSVSEADMTKELVASFPAMSQSAADLETIFAVASQHRVELAKGEYQLKAEPNTPFLAYTATFPVRNDYGTVKDFSADVLTALPHASMDELRMTRDAAGSASLDAVIRFTLFYRSQ